MHWLLLLGFLLLLAVPWWLYKRTNHPYRGRLRSWRKHRNLTYRSDSIQLTLRTYSVERKSDPAPLESPLRVGGGPQTGLIAPEQRDRLRSQQTAATTKTVEVLPEYQPQRNHRHNIQAAKLQLEQLREYVRTVPAEDVLKIVIGTLRRTKPFVFEELLLHCFKEQGYQVVRNERYTGDDGIDGRLYKDGKLYFVQAKRYSGLIQAAHVQEFEAVIEEFGAVGGFFVHTGRTGDRSRGVLRQPGSKIVLVSGMGVVNLVLGREVRTLKL